MKPEQILKKLITFQTLTKAAGEHRRSFQWIKNLLKGISVHIRMLTIGDQPSLLITTQPTRRPLLWLVTHQDVVPGSAALFKPKTIGDKLIGRGVFDMKYALACYLALLLELKSELSRYNFGIMITTDEEIGGTLGVGSLLKQGYRSRAAIVPDGGADWSIEQSAKGVWTFRVESRGISGHSSRPWSGKNAIVTLAAFLSELENRTDPEPCRDPKHRHATMNIGRIEGGTVANQIPDYAAATIDVRFLTSSQKNKIQRIVTSLQKKFKDIRIKPIISALPAHFDTRGRVFIAFSSAAKELFNIKTHEIISHGTSDARFFSQHKIPALVTRPKGGGHHTEYEWISRRDLARFYSVLKSTVQKLAKP